MTHKVPRGFLRCGGADAGRHLHDGERPRPRHARRHGARMTTPAPPPQHHRTHARGIHIQSAPSIPHLHARTLPIPQRHLVTMSGPPAPPIKVVTLNLWGLGFSLSSKRAERVW